MTQFGPPKGPHGHNQPDGPYWSNQPQHPQQHGPQPGQPYGHPSAHGQPPPYRNPQQPGYTPAPAMGQQGPMGHGHPAPNPFGPPQQHQQAKPAQPPTSRALPQSAAVNLFAPWLPKDHGQLHASTLESVRSGVSRQNARRLEKYRPTSKKRMWAWIVFAFGVMMLVTMFSPDSRTGEFSISGALFSASMAVTFLVPSGYWLWRTKEDQKMIKEFVEGKTQLAENWQYLDESEKHLLGVGNTLPKLPERQWKAIIIGLVVWFIITSILFA